MRNNKWANEFRTLPTMIATIIIYVNLTWKFTSFHFMINIIIRFRFIINKNLTWYSVRVMYFHLFMFSSANFIFLLTLKNKIKTFAAIFTDCQLRIIVCLSISFYMLIVWHVCLFVCADKFSGLDSKYI